MNNQEFIKRVSETTGFNQRDIKSVFDAMKITVIECINNNDSVIITQGMKAVPVEKKARQVKLPTTGEVIDIPEKRSIKVNFSDGFLRNICR